IHRMMIFVAMKWPVPGIISDKLDRARRAGRDVYRRFRPPRAFWDRSAIGSDHPPAMTMKMNRVTVHAQVSETDSHTLIQFHNERICARPNATVKGEQIEIRHDVRVRC